MKRLNFNILALLLALCVCLPAAAQNEKHLVRKGNRQYGGGKFHESAASYGKAAAVDSNSFAAQYNLASSLLRSTRISSTIRFRRRIRTGMVRTVKIHPIIRISPKALRVREL